MPRLAPTLLVFAVCFTAAPAFAQGPFVQGPSGHHGQGHAENHDWYEKLKRPGSNASCCSGSKDGVEGDCRPTRAYQKDDGNWYALLNGRWVPVPPKVAPDTTLVRPVAADWSPLTSKVPALTNVAPA